MCHSHRPIAHTLRTGIRELCHIALQHLRYTPYPCADHKQAAAAACTKREGVIQECLHTAMVTNPTDLAASTIAMQNASVSEQFKKMWPRRSTCEEPHDEHTNTLCAVSLLRA